MLQSSAVEALENAEQEVNMHSMEADQTLDSARDQVIGAVELDADEVYRIVVV